jgi:hypothetical protein
MLRGLMQQLGFWTTLLSWQEPPQFRTRLRGDMLVRLAIAAAVGCVPMTLLMVLFAINNNPPHPAFALIGFLIGSALAGLMLFAGESSAGGAVRVCQEGITRKRSYVPKIPVHQAFEEASWPYESMSRVIIVPANAIRQSFSLLLITDEQSVEMVGVPSKIPLAQLAQTLAARGVRVEQGSFVPESFTRPLAWPIGAGAGAVGLMLLVGGLGFYAIKSMGGGGQIARAPAADNQPAASPIVVVDMPPAQANSAPPPPPPVQSAPPPAENVPTSVPPIGRFPRAPAGNRNPFDPFAGLPAAAPGAATVQGETGEVVGGKGGFVFRSASPGGQPVVGFRVATGQWAGKKALASLDPLFDRTAPLGSWGVVAKEGYVVGGLEIDAADLVYAVKVVFVRHQADGSLDTADTYTSDWLGTPSGNAPKKLTSSNQPIIGIHGRKGAVMDAVGLVVAGE